MMKYCVCVLSYGDGESDDNRTGLSIEFFETLEECNDFLSRFYTDKVKWNGYDLFDESAGCVGLLAKKVPQ